MTKTKITQPKQPCRKCGTPVVKCIHASDWKPKPNQAYWFDWWLKCPECGETYMVEAAKIVRGDNAEARVSVALDHDAMRQTQFEVKQ